MDRVFFELKRAHFETVKWTRKVLAEFGLTPARFDVLFALRGTSDMTQIELRRLLGVARATISEMLDVLERLELVVRARARDRRTWFVALTAKGTAAIRRAADATMHSGFVPLIVDAALTSRDVERDGFVERVSLDGHLNALLGELGLRLARLYEDDPDLEWALIPLHDPCGEFNPTSSRSD